MRKEKVREIERYKGREICRNTFLPFKETKNFGWVNQNNKIKNFRRNGGSI